MGSGVGVLAFLALDGLGLRGREMVVGSLGSVVFALGLGFSAFSVGAGVLDSLGLEASTDFGREDEGVDFDTASGFSASFADLVGFFDFDSGSSSLRDFFDTAGVESVLPTSFTSGSSVFLRFRDFAGALAVDAFVSATEEGSLAFFSFFEADLEAAAGGILVDKANEIIPGSKMCRVMHNMP